MYRCMQLQGWTLLKILPNRWIKYSVCLFVLPNACAIVTVVAVIFKVWQHHIPQCGWHDKMLTIFLYICYTLDYITLHLMFGCLRETRIWFWPWTWLPAKLVLREFPECERSAKHPYAQNVLRTMNFNELLSLCIKPANSDASMTSSSVTSPALSWELVLSAAVTVSLILGLSLIANNRY